MITASADVTLMAQNRTGRRHPKDGWPTIHLLDLGLPHRVGCIAYPCLLCVRIGRHRRRTWKIKRGTLLKDSWLQEPRQILIRIVLCPVKASVGFGRENGFPTLMPMILPPALFPDGQAGRPSSVDEFAWRCTFD